MPIVTLPEAEDCITITPSLSLDESLDKDELATKIIVIKTFEPVSTETVLKNTTDIVKQDTRRCN